MRTEPERSSHQPCACGVGGTEQHRRYDKAHRELHALTWGGFRAVLRRYCVSAAAKDCSVMIALAQETSGEQPHTESQDVAARHPQKGALCGGCAHVLREFAHRQVQPGGVATVPQGPVEEVHGGKRAGAEVSGAGGLSGGDVKHSCTERVAFGGSVFCVRLVAVDLDRKPLGKVRKHWEKDRQILELAREEGAGAAGAVSAPQ